MEEGKQVQREEMKTSENYLRDKPLGRAGKIGKNFNIRQSESCKKNIRNFAHKLSRILKALKLSIIWDSLGNEVLRLNEKLQKYFL